MTTTEERRRSTTRVPWVFAGLALVGLVPTAILTMVNGSIDEDPLFIPVAMMMIAGYSVTGAVLASRHPRNAVGWLLLTIGLWFLLTGFSDEFMQWLYREGPTTNPLGQVFGLISNVLWLPMIATASLLFLLFPTGRVPGPRWRFLPWVIGSAVALFLLASILHPGPLEDTGLEDIVVRNPLGVPGEDLPHVSHFFTEAHPYWQQRVVVVGGGNSAVETALELHRVGAQVTIVHFLDQFDRGVKPWVLPDIVNAQGESVAAPGGGFLVLRRPWPSMLRTLWGDDELAVRTRYSDELHHEFAGQMEEIVSRAVPDLGAERRRGLHGVALGRGEVVSELLGLVRRERISVVVLGWHGRLAVGRAETLKRLLSALDTPLLLVKPEAPTEFRLKVGEELE